MAKVLSQKEEDIKMLLAADAHLGTKNVKFQMERYVFKRRPGGICIINLGKTYGQRVVMKVAIENPQEIIVQSAGPYAQRGVLKVADFINAEPLAGKHNPRTFTNRMQKNERRFPVKSSDLRKRSSSSRLS